MPKILNGPSLLTWQSSMSSIIFGPFKLLGNAHLFNWLFRWPVCVDMWCRSCWPEVRIWRRVREKVRRISNLLKTFVVEFECELRHIPTLRVKIARRNKAWRGNFRPVKPHSEWDTRYIALCRCVYVLSLQTRGKQIYLLSFIHWLIYVLHNAKTLCKFLCLSTMSVDICPRADDTVDVKRFWKCFSLKCVLSFFKKYFRHFIKFLGQLKYRLFEYH